MHHWCVMTARCELSSCSGIKYASHHPRLFFGDQVCWTLGRRQPVWFSSLLDPTAFPCLIIRTKRVHIKQRGSIFQQLLPLLWNHVAEEWHGRESMKQYSKCNWKSQIFQPFTWITILTTYSSVNMELKLHSQLLYHYFSGKQFGRAAHWNCVWHVHC